jgi:Galactose oxidase, central domain
MPPKMRVALVRVPGCVSDTKKQVESSIKPMISDSAVGKSMSAAAGNAAAEFDMMIRCHAMTSSDSIQDADMMMLPSANSSKRDMSSRQLMTSNPPARLKRRKLDLVALPSSNNSMASESVQAHDDISEIESFSPLNTPKLSGVPASQPARDESSSAVGPLSGVRCGSSATSASDSQESDDVKLPDVLGWSTIGDSGASATAQPPPMWGYATVALPDDTDLLYGGADTKRVFDDVYVFDRKSFSWSHVEISSAAQARVWHSASYLPQQHVVFVFGGECKDATGEPEILSDPMLFDVDVQLWYQPKFNGPSPRPRGGHSASVLTGDHVVLFGGCNGRKWLNDINVLDASTWTWSRPRVQGTTPAARSYHSAVVIGGDSIVIFGGNDSTKCFDSVHVLHRKTTCTTTPPPSVSWEWQTPIVMGSAPRARTGHGCTVVDDRFMVIHGGWDPNAADLDDPTQTASFSDAFVLDTKSWTWHIISEHETNMPGVRVGHSMSQLVQQSASEPDSRRIFTFAGLGAKDAMCNTALQLQFVPPSI